MANFIKPTNMLEALSIGISAHRSFPLSVDVRVFFVFLSWVWVALSTGNTKYVISEAVGKERFDLEFGGVTASTFRRASLTVPCSACKGV